MTDPTITREEIERWRTQALLGPMTLLDSSDARRIIDAITAHPAALERARAEGVMSAYNAVSAIKHTDEGHARGLEDAEAAIRALGPVPRPSPEAEAPKESATKWLAVNFRKRAQALRVAAEHGESPAAWHAAAETYETAAGVAERWRPTPGAVEATTPPALAPELWERLAKVLQWAGGLGNSIYSPEARALLSALSPQTDGGAK